MSLTHEFAIINQNGDFDSDSEKISISDTLILYMIDSLDWINSLWNGTEEKKGINYYGETIIKEKNVDKLWEVIHAWIKLFELSTDEFILTGNYLLEEASYEKYYLIK